MNINDLHKNAHTGDKAAEDKLFRVLSERFEQFVHRRIWDEERAKDIVQDALTIIAKEYKGIKFEKSFSAWAYKVLDNRILSYIKMKKQQDSKIVELPVSDFPSDASYNQDPDLRLKLLECLKKVHEANPRHATILDLHCQGYNTKEICDKMQLTRNSFYIALHRARKMLENCMRTGVV